MLPPIIRRRHPLTVKAGIRRITVRETRSRMADLESRSTPMEFTGLFLAVIIVMLAAWLGTFARQTTESDTICCCAEPVTVMV